MFEIWGRFDNFAIKRTPEMKHIHIELVGREIQPTYTMLKQFSPDKVLFVCSKQTRDNINQINIHTNGLACEREYVTLEPHNLTAINDWIDSLVSELSDDDILSLNLVGGTKFWALALYKRFANRPNTHFFLIGQDDTLWNLSNNASTSLKSIDLDTIISLQGQTVKSYTLLSNYTEDDHKVLKQVEKIRRKNFSVFNRLVSVLSKEEQKKIANNPSGIIQDNHNWVSWSKPDQVEFNVDNVVTKLCSPHAIDIAFNSGWFEYKVAKLIEGWDRCQEIRINSVFISQNGETKNEIDIIVETGSKPIFVECKTQIKNHTDLDKFATVVKNFSGKGGKAVFISDAPLKTSAKTKCKESGIEYFSLQQHPHNLQDDLYSFLDDVINKINA